MEMGKAKTSFVFGHHVQPYGKIGWTISKFGRTISKFGRTMSDGRLLFPALLLVGDKAATDCRVENHPKEASEA